MTPLERAHHRRSQLTFLIMCASGQEEILLRWHAKQLDEIISRTSRAKNQVNATIALTGWLDLYERAFWPDTRGKPLGNPAQDLLAEVKEAQK